LLPRRASLFRCCRSFAGKSVIGALVGLSLGVVSAQQAGPGVLPGNGGGGSSGSAAASGCGTTLAGSNRYVIFNDSGACGGAEYLLYDKDGTGSLYSRRAKVAVGVANQSSVDALAIYNVAAGRTKALVFQARDSGAAWMQHDGTAGTGGIEITETVGRVGISGVGVILSGGLPTVSHTGALYNFTTEGYSPRVINVTAAAYTVDSTSGTVPDHVLLWNRSSVGTIDLPTINTTAVRPATDNYRTITIKNVGSAVLTVNGFPGPFPPAALIYPTVWSGSVASIDLSPGESVVLQASNDGSTTYGWHVVGQAGNLDFASGNGLAFAGPTGPVTLKGADVGGNTTLNIDNTVDSYVRIGLPQYTDINFSSNGGSLNQGSAYVWLHDSVVEVNLLTATGGLTADSYAGGPFALGKVITSNTAFTNTNLLYTEFNATDGAAPAAGTNSFNSNSIFGAGGIAAKGSVNALAGNVIVQGSGSADNEWALFNGGLRVDIGTGYTQSAGPTGDAWGLDMGTMGPIAVQPGKLYGGNMILNNYYNGSPLDSPSVGFAIVTYKPAGPGNDGTHGAANSYPNDIGLSITGVSNNGSNQVGWTKGIQIGGTASGWGEPASIIGTGIHIRDYTTRGILIDNPSGSPTASIDANGLILAALFGTKTNCSDSAGAAACGAAAAGSVVIDASATTVVVSTTAVTADSQILIQEDPSLATRLSVTCNTTTGRDYTVTARTGGTSFTITASAAPTSNPACLSYVIVN
jgi:hypothetical protein